MQGSFDVEWEALRAARTRLAVRLGLRVRGENGHHGHRSVRGDAAANGELGIDLAGITLIPILVDDTERTHGVSALRTARPLARVVNDTGLGAPYTSA